MKKGLKYVKSKVDKIKTKSKSSSSSGGGGSSSGGGGGSSGGGDDEGESDNYSSGSGASRK